MPARIMPAQPPFSQEIQSRLDRIMPPGIPPLQLFTTLARDPRLFSRFMSGALLDQGNLSLRQREIVICRVTAQCGSQYEWGVHIAFFGTAAQFDPAQIHSLVYGSADDDCWADEGERILLRICDALHETCSIGDDIWGTLSRHFSEEAVLEVLMLAGQYRMVSYLTNAIHLPLEPFAARFPGKQAKSRETV